MDANIIIKNENVKIPEELINVVGGDELLARIFFNRGFKDADSIRQMLYEEYYIPAKSSDFPGIDEAVRLITDYIKAGSLIAVYGDYDVDGVTSTALLMQCLGNFTSKIVYHVPDRFTEGYGMNSQVIRELGEKGVSLIITCDCGISNLEEIRLAKEMGMKVVITDHHNLPEILPLADVMVNPKFLPEGHQAREISGCATAYFLSLAILNHYGREKEAVDYLDLVALSLVADVVNLKGENRYLLKKAIPKLFNTSRIGLVGLFSVIGKKVEINSEEDIGFQIAPRINAAGRMASARLSVELLICTNHEAAGTIARQIDHLNMERKRIQQDIIEQAAEMVEDKKKNRTVLVLFNEYWHHGIIGIAAGKISEIYGKPTILMSLKEDGNTVVGSARSVEGIDIYELIKECSSRLVRFGGHTLAAGLSLKKEELVAFTEEIEALADKKYYIRNRKDINVDCELDLNLIDEDLYSKLSSIGPFGEGFEAPNFVTREVSVISDRRTDKNHHIMVLAGKNDFRIPAVKWFGDQSDYLGKVLDITYKIGRNNYRGNAQIQLTLDSMLEIERKRQKAYEGSFIDERNKSIHEILQRYEDSLVFYEGIKANCPVKETIDRNKLKSNVKNSTLIFLSSPANSSILREAVAIVNPKNVVINFSVLPDYSFKGFVLNLMGIVKHMAVNENSRTNLEILASRMCVEESIVRAALKYIRAMGKLDYIIEDREVVINICNKTQENNLNLIEKNLKTALLEKNAYQQFLLKVEIDKFKEYM